ncbi:hypothetical protein CCY99_07220 [Helicobacter sp. 16-1353]|uniref:rhodanese-like domain-containing protein n=1 Tax=Helicobacter sp. 16-1353 TaxID=2004996 RepID=UPI000DCB57D9|nr:rhodanese-like domain-containing protein [Helicobacter sp. 16-1353]RAX52749.1 hypothetical protein CCY99_07220 [Helicobacter sp. 16-1353]
MNKNTSPRAVNPKDLKKMIDNCILIDVRNKGYFLIDHLKDSINVESAKRIGYIAQENKDKKILLYCHSGTTAKNISDELANSGIDNVYYVNGSFSEIVKADVEIIYYNQEK